MGKRKIEEEDEDDKKLEEELLQLVEILSTKDENLVAVTLPQLRLLIQTSTTSMTSVPKPLKYLRSSYDILKDVHSKMSSGRVKRELADILSVLAVASDTSQNRECLGFCLRGTMLDPGAWGHEYVRKLETEIIEEWSNATVRTEVELLPLIKKIVCFDMKNNTEVQACDLTLEIDQLNLLDEYLDSRNFLKVCHYLSNCADYSEETERRHILETVASHYLRFNEHARALLVALQLSNADLVSKCFSSCCDPSVRKQMALILSRQKDYTLNLENLGGDTSDIESILSNSHVNPHFQCLTRELDILEPKSPEDIYKTWLLETVTTSFGFFRTRPEHDSARANLASSFVTAFVHAAFGKDKLMADTEDCWVYKNKDHGMLSATASLGLIHIWDVDGGLVPIDKYLYSSESYVKSGALLAIGLVNCGIRNECDPAFALLSDYARSENQILQIGSVLGLGLAYAGSQRSDVSDLLMGVLADQQSNMEITSLAAISLGLINVGSSNPEVSSTILQRLLDLPPQDLDSTYSRFLPLALGMLYMGCRDSIETLSTALEVLPEPHRLSSQTTLQICSYAGSGDVLIIQELLRTCSEPAEGDLSAKSSRVSTTLPGGSCCDPKSQMLSFFANSAAELKPKPADTGKDDGISKEAGLPQAMATLGVALVALGNGKENSRIFGQIGRYGYIQARRAVPLAIALSSLSNPDLPLMDVLHKYSHDNDPEVANNAIIALGLLGAGTNNARLATMLRQLAAYHAKNPSHLFLIRISQGLIHLGKGTLSLKPLHYGSKILDKAALAGLLVVLVAFLDCKNLILGKSHYLLYCLAAAMEPRWLVTLDENLEAIPVSVRIGQSVDIVGKAGNPKSIAGGHVNTTPVLINNDEKAELVIQDEYKALSSVLEGFVILRREE